MRERIWGVLSSTRTVRVACAVSLVVGLFFVWVWAPHPWGWRGIDQYHDLALAIARGEGFLTTDVPWGYAYYVGTLYALFGPHPWLPVTLQAILNGAMPFLLYRLVRPSTTQQTAVLGALLLGLFSFNTVYASTQSSDSLCNILFVASLLAFDKGRRHGKFAWFVLSGLLSGLVPQFRPNMLLFPAVLATAYVVLARPRHARIQHALVYVLMSLLPLAPWVVRNYELTGLFLPTSTHGPVQLWYGSLQVGPYLERRTQNPRSYFEPPAFDYTSLTDTSVIVSAMPRGCPFWTDATAQLVYWTDDDTRRKAVPGNRVGSEFRFEMPGQPDGTVIYYYLEARSRRNDEEVASITPPFGDRVPSVLFVSSNHLGDLDEHGDFVDVFDVIRSLQQQRPETAALVNQLLALTTGRADVVQNISTADGRVVLTLTDGSTFSAPRDAVQSITDVEVSGGWSAALLHTRQRTNAPGVEDLEGLDGCPLFDKVRANDVFYRKEPHQMRRYTALAMDNIFEAPGAFLVASLYRMLRLFIVVGTDDISTAQQFSSSAFVYGVGTVLSGALFILMCAGVVIAWRRRYPLLVLVLPIAYVPLTICFVLTNMRYAVTVQPFVFVFVAIALLPALTPGAAAQSLADPAK